MRLDEIEENQSTSENETCPVVNMRFCYGPQDRWSEMLWQPPIRLAYGLSGSGELLMFTGLSENKTGDVQPTSEDTYFEQILCDFAPLIENPGRLRWPRVYGLGLRPLTVGIEGSNPATGMDVCLL